MHYRLISGTEMSSVLQGLFLHEILRDLLGVFLPKISLKFAKWKENSRTKLSFSQEFC